MGGSHYEASVKQLGTSVSRRKPIRSLLVVWALLVVALVLALPFDAPTFRTVARALGVHLLFLKSPAQSANVTPQLEWLSRYDPKPGTEAPPRLVQAIGDDGPPKHNLIVYLGSCSGCSLKLQQEKSWFADSSWYTATALVDAGTDLATVRQRVGAKTRIVVDEQASAAEPNRTIAFRINAHFAPRVYLYGPDWRLVCVSRYGEALDAFLERSKQR